jgi:HAE1 family hydrophobic/amphiphilic exporter-1
MQLIDSFVRNPVKVMVGMLLVALFGYVAVVQMPMQLTPEVQTPTITVETRWPGASPQEIEQQIILEQEEYLKGVEGVTKMTSESADSLGKITLEFLVGTNMDRALLLVNSRLQQVPNYPEDADQPVITTANSSDRPIAWFILSPQPPTDDQLNAFEARYPELKEKLVPVRRTKNIGLAMLRLRNLAREDARFNEILPPPDLDVTKLRRFAEDEIEARFERVAGVSQSNVTGGLEDELQVIIDPDRLAARGLTIEDVRRVLQGQNRDTSAGDYWEGKRRWVVRTLGQFRSPEQVENQVLAEKDGSFVYVRDVADVKLGFKKPDGLVRRFGESSVAINVIRETGANVLEVMEGLREVNKELNEGILRGGHFQDWPLTLTQVYDETEYIYSAIALVQENIFVGSALTMVVLMMFLHLSVPTLVCVPMLMASAFASVYLSPLYFALTLAIIVGAGFWFARGSLVVGLAIPTSIIGTFLVMGMLGRSLNVISLAGLAFAVGMLVDNAVVVLENIYTRFHRGESATEAAVRGTHEVWGAVVASTLTTVAVFLPIVFVQQEAGQLFRDIALAISAAVGLSMVVAVTIIPVFAARLLTKAAEGGKDVAGLASFAPEPKPAHHKSADASMVTARRNLPWPEESAGNGHGNGDHHATGHGNAPEQAQGKTQWLVGAINYCGELFVNTVVGVNSWIQRGLLRRLGVVLGMLAVSFAITWLLWPKVEYLPTGNRNLVIGILLPPPGYSMDQLQELGQQVEDALESYWNVDEVEAEGRDTPVISDFFYVARDRQVFLGLRSHDPMRVPDLIPVVRKVGAALPGTITIANQSSLFEQGLGAGRTIDVEIAGPDLAKLVELGGYVMGKVGQVFPPGTQSRPVPSLDLNSPEVHVLPKIVQAAEMGISTSELGYAVNALVDGAYAGDYYIGGDKIDLTIMGQQARAAQSQDIGALPVATPLQRVVPLGALADVNIEYGPEKVQHRERIRAVTIQVSPPPEMPLQDAMERIQNDIVSPMVAAGMLGVGYRVNLEGTADKLRQTWGALEGNVKLALCITYLLMAALFESWLYPLVIILTVPLGAVGGVVGLQLLNLFYLQPLDVLTMLGFVILIGTVVNNPILIVHQSLNHIREDGMSARDAILESTRTRIRPIFMTTITTVLGLLPLVLFPGAGSELYRGLGSVVLGGLLVSTFFTLFLVPTLFGLTMEAKEALYSLIWPADKSEDQPAPPQTPAPAAPVASAPAGAALPAGRPGDPS